MFHEFFLHLFSALPRGFHAGLPKVKTENRYSYNPVCIPESTGTRVMQVPAAGEYPGRAVGTDEPDPRRAQGGGKGKPLALKNMKI